jgi:hypothetical protein
MPRKKDEEVAKKTAQVGLVEWKNSNGKKLLKKELWDVSSRYHSMSIKDIHASDECFSAYPLKNFSANFKSLKKKLDELRAQVEFDNQAVSEQKKLFPRSPTTKRGYPHWNDHPAKVHVEDDVHNGIADNMLPRELRMTRLTYQEFPEDIFCVRVHAEKRKQREQTFWVAKRNKSAMQRHLKEVAEMRKSRGG